METGAIGLLGLRVQPHVATATSHGFVCATTHHRKRGAEVAQATPGRHGLATIRFAPVSISAHLYRAVSSLAGAQANKCVVV